MTASPLSCCVTCSICWATLALHPTARSLGSYSYNACHRQFAWFLHLRLPSSSADLSLQQLAEMADRILEVSHVPTVAPVTDPNVSEMRQLTTTLTRLVAALDATPLSHSRESSDSRCQSRPSRSPSRPPSQQLL